MVLEAGPSIPIGVKGTGVGNHAILVVVPGSAAHIEDMVRMRCRGSRRLGNQRHRQRCIDRGRLAGFEVGEPLHIGIKTVPNFIDRQFHHFPRELIRVLGRNQSAESDNDHFSNPAIFGGQTKDLPPWSLEVKAGRVGIFDLLHSEVEQPLFDLLHIFRFNLQPCSFQVNFLGKHIGLFAKEDAKNESVGEEKQVQVWGRAGNGRALKDIEVERPHSFAKTFVDVELHVVTDTGQGSFLSRLV